MRPDVVAACGPYRLVVPSTALSGGAGDRMGRGTGASLEFTDFRDYVAGDDLRHVDWRAYARTDGLKVRLFRDEVAPHLDLVLDVSTVAATTAGAASSAVNTIPRPPPGSAGVASTARSGERGACARTRGDSGPGSVTAHSQNGRRSSAATVTKSAITAETLLGPMPRVS